MTPAQAHVLATITRLTVDGVSPSYRDLAKALDIHSLQAIHAMLHRLRALGLVDFEDGRKRTLRVVGAEMLRGMNRVELRRLRTQINTKLREMQADA